MTSSNSSSDEIALQQQLESALNHYKAGQLTVAAAVCQQVLQQQPDVVEAIALLGRIAEQLGHHEAAAHYLLQVAKLRPDSAETYNLLGNALQRLRKFAESVSCYQRAIALQPNFPGAYNNLGSALQELGRYQASVLCYQKALQLRPDYADAYYNLGNNYRHQDNLEAARRAYAQAIALDPNFTLAYNNLGLTLADMGKPEEAIPWYERAIALQPDNADAHQNLGLALLQLGDLETGFREYEWRWQAMGPDNRPPRPFPQPLWDGSDLHGKTILLHAEQGYGDTLQFVRYAALVAAKGGRVLLECQPALTRLLATLPHVAQVIPAGDPLPPFDTHAPLLSLPHLLHTTLATVPSQIPYLFPPAAPALLTRSSAPRHIGIVWSGSPTHQNDRRRSCPLHEFLPLLQLPYIRFHSLQIGPRAEEIRPLVEQGLVEDWSDRLHDFADTATLIAQLDLVITVDTSVAHLAGGLGKPVWVLLSYAPDWRWLLHRTDSPWYPTARLFRQPSPGDWKTPIHQVITSLKGHVAAVTPLPSPSPAPPASSAPTPLGIGWEIGNNTGWRVFGLNLTLQLLKRPDIEPVPLLPLGQPETLNPLQRELLQPSMTHQQRLWRQLQQHPDQVATCNFLILKGMGNRGMIAPQMQRLVGRHNVAMIFSEDTQWDAQGLAIAHRFDRILAGSSWNAAVLRSVGISQVQTVLQGIDPSLFHPAPRSGLFGDRFVIFSGGKLEYRKGQDIVVAAFKAFHSRHPEALLLTSWHNQWPQTMAEIERGGYVSGVPTATPSGRLQIKAWLMQNGIPGDAVVDVGAIANDQSAQILREADAALFPNRAEGGTNLVAMECLACGIPTILSANTGHLDLIRDDCCYPLRQQGKVASTPQFWGTEGWGESAVDEIVETLEIIYQNRDEAQQRSKQAVLLMQEWTWEKQVKRLVEAIADLL